GIRLVEQPLHQLLFSLAPEDLPGEAVSEDEFGPLAIKNQNNGRKLLKLCAGILLGGGVLPAKVAELVLKLTVPALMHTSLHQRHKKHSPCEGGQKARQG